MMKPTLVWTSPVSFALAIALAAMTAATTSLRSQGAPVSNAAPQSRDASTVPAAAGNSTIRGRVVDAVDGHPIRGVRIQIPSRSIPDVFTGDDGRFTLAGLSAGRYTLTAAKAGYVTTWRRDRSPSDFQIAGPPIDLGSGQDIEQIDFALTKGGVITGRVVDDRSREVIGARVYVYRSRWQDGRQVVAASGLAADHTNDLGEFRLFGLPPGTYLLGVSFGRPTADGLVLVTVYYPGSLQADGAQPVVVRSGEEFSATITLPAVPTGSIAGTVRQEDGQLLQGGSVYGRLVSRVEREPIGAGIRADGSYRLAGLLPGEYEISVATTGTTAKRFASARVIVDEQQDVFVPLTVSAGGTIRGRYRFDTGAPPADVKPPSGTGVQPVVLPHDDLRSMSVGADWRFSVTGLSGAYRLTPPSPVGWFVKRITRDGRDVTYQPIEIAGETIDGVEVLLTQRATQLAVSLEGSDTELDDATVLIFAEDESLLWYRSPFQRFIRIDQRGSISGTLQWQDRRSFTASALPPARYYVVAIVQLEYGQETNPALLRQLTAIASKVELVENETRQVALKITKLP